MLQNNKLGQTRPEGFGQKLANLFLHLLAIGAIGVAALAIVLDKPIAKLIKLYKKHSTAIFGSKQQ